MSFTDPRLLNSVVHADFSTGTGVWNDYRANVVDLFTSGSGANQADYRDHVIREFNRKISVLNQDTGLFIAPYDDGFRYTGV